MSSQLHMLVRAMARPTIGAPAARLSSIMRTAIIFIIALPPILACLVLVAICWTIEWRAGLVFTAVSSLLWLGWPTLSALRRRSATLAQHRALSAALQHRLRAAGLASDAQTPEAIALRESFWREAQHDALVSLRTRSMRHHSSRDLVEVISDFVAESKSVIIGLTLAWAALTIAGLVSSYHDEPLAQSLPYLLLFFVMSMGAYSVGLFYLISILSLGDLINERVEQRELTRETRRVSDIMEAAGGLSLAEDEVRALLVGAISQPAQLGGEVELLPAAPPLQPEEP